MKRLLLAIVLFAACHGNESSPTAPPLSTAALTGKVTNAATSAPLSAVSVSATQSGQTITTLSASTGNYSFFAGLLPGSVKITATAKGFTTFTGNTTVSTGSNRYDIQLQPSP
jgi:carboxypeptidase family protein